MDAAVSRIAATVLVLAAALTACNGDDPVAPTPTGSIFVVHGVPGLDLQAPSELPVDIRIGEQCVLQDLTYGDVSQAVTAPAGTYTVEVRSGDAATACGGEVLITGENVQLGANQSVSVVAHLDAQHQPVLTRFENDRSSAAGPRVVARHTAAHGAVDVWLDEEVLFANLSNGQQQTAVATAGIANVAVTDAGETEPLFTATAPLQNNVVYLAYAVGSAANETFTVVLQTLTMQ